MTLRDKIWNTAIELLVAKGKFKASELMEKGGLREEQRQTVRRCLNEMEEKGWLERTSRQSAIWRLGWKGKMLLNVSEETIEQSQE